MMLINCENCDTPTAEDQLATAMDSSDGNRYEMCPECRRKHSRLFQAELEEHYERETEGLMEEHRRRHADK